MTNRSTPIRHLIVILGDQLDANSAAFDGFESSQDLVWMAEVAAEAEHVWCHKARIVIFLSAMRHFRDALRDRDIGVDYRELDEQSNLGVLDREFEAAVKRWKPERVVMVEPGEWRVREMFLDVARHLAVELDMRVDRHFLCSHEQFEDHAKGRKQLRLEYFYRELRRKHDILIQDDKPVGGKWNYDAENRGTFGKSGPNDLPSPRRFKADSVTQEVKALVEKKFSQHPGRLEHFDWPVTASEAKLALDDFVRHRLSRFGQYQDAMWTGEPYLYHSRLSAAMNLKLLDPRDVIDAAVSAYVGDDAPLNAVEGFVRQVLGWREYVRGIYWLLMPGYLERNTLKANRRLPDFYWTGETEMNCMREAIGQTLEYGYAHHIQRLMVTGLYALLLGVKPQAVHEWYLAVYVDAVEWVELPNTLGMSQFADGGVMASKPYAATGKYIQRMSNYCSGCRFNPAKTTGEDACPFTTLYWDFLRRHKKLLENNQRTLLQIKNLNRLSAEDQKAIRARAKEWQNQASS